jgi:hypothetical protein
VDYWVCSVGDCLVDYLANERGLLACGLLGVKGRLLASELLGMELDYRLVEYWAWSVDYWLVDNRRGAWTNSLWTIWAMSVDY